MASVNIYDRETKECKEVANKTKAAILDSVMSDESTNAVQNKVIKEYTDNSVERLNEAVFNTIEKTHKLGVVENELFIGNDLNNCLEVGIYKIPYAGVANEIANIPEKVAGKLIVEDSIGGTDDINSAENAYFTQTYMTVTGNSYTRTIFKEGTASLRFGEWKQNTAGITNESISDEWYSHITYGVGAYVIYNNSLWKCLVQNAGQTPVEGTHWTKVSIAGEISKLNSDYLSVNKVLKYPSNLYLDDISTIWTESKVKKLLDYLYTYKTSDVGSFIVQNGYTCAGLYMLYDNNRYSCIILFSYAINCFYIFRKNDDNIDIKRVDFVDV